jgi:hypothetical protein
VIQRLLKDTAVAAEALYFLAAAPEMAGVSGRYFNLTIEETPAPHAVDPESARRVWEVSEELTGIRTDGGTHG